MKRLVVFLIAVISVVPFAAAQTVADEIALTRAQIRADRQAIVAAALELNDAQGQAFWPLYREYRSEMEVQGDRVWQLLVEFADKYESLSDADAAKMLDEWTSIEKKQIDIRSRWAKKFSKAIGAATTARFYQVESKLDSLIRLEATANVPLAVPAK